MPQRDYSFDFCKGVLIFLVVYGHVLNYYLNEDYLTNSVYTFIYSFHMPAFFIISGIFARKAVNLTVWECAHSKFERLAMPALIWSFFSIFLNYFLFMKSDSLGMVIVGSFRTTWFLWALFLFFVIATVIWKSKYKYYIAIVLSVVLWVTHKWQNPYIFDYLHISREWPCFLAGLLYSEYKYEGKELSKKYSILLWLFALVIYCINYYRYVNGLGGYETRCVLLLAAGIVFLPIILKSYDKLMNYGPKISFFFVSLGGTSMGIYLVDGIGKKLINSFINDLLSTNAFYLIPMAFIYVLVWYAITSLIRKNIMTHYRPVKVNKKFFEIIEI